MGLESPPEDPNRPDTILRKAISGFRDHLANVLLGNTAGGKGGGSLAENFRKFASQPMKLLKKDGMCFTKVKMGFPVGSMVLGMMKNANDCAAAVNALVKEYTRMNTSAKLCDGVQVMKSGWKAITANYKPKWRNNKPTKYFLYGKKQYQGWCMYYTEKAAGKKDKDGYISKGSLQDKGCLTAIGLKPNPKPRKKKGKREGMRIRKMVALLEEEVASHDSQTKKPLNRKGPAAIIHAASKAGSVKGEVKGKLRRKRAKRAVSKATAMGEGVASHDSQMTTKKKSMWKEDANWDFYALQ